VGLFVFPLWGSAVLFEKYEIAGSGQIGVSFHPELLGRTAGSDLPIIIGQYMMHDVSSRKVV